MRVVIIEDSEIVRTRLERMLSGVPGLELAGYADDVESALALIEQARPDAVVLDVSLKSGNGMRVLEQVRRRRPALVVVVLTNHATPEYRDEAMALGADAFLDKSQDFDRVVAMLQAADGTDTHLLRADAALFHALADATTDAIAVSEDGILREVNEGFLRLFGCQPGEVIGRPVVEIVPEEYRAAAAERLNREALEPFDATVDTADGRRVEVLIASRTCLIGGRRLRLTTFRDVTLQRRLERQVRELEKYDALGRLAGAVAHDFNNLLTVIGSLNAMMLHTTASDDPDCDDLAAIAATVERGRSLARQLQTFGSPSEDECRTVALAAAIAAAEPILATAVGARIALRLRLLSNGVRACIRGGTLDQVLLNLAVNARDAMPEGGTLTITADVVHRDHDEDGLPAGPYARIVVADTGIGMDRTTCLRVFEPFFSTKPVGVGTGLGLATVHGIVRQSGGRISVESEPGRGTAFEILLPTADGEG